MVVGGLVLLAIALVPTGLVLLRLLEGIGRHRYPLTTVERLVVAFYATGLLFFLIASVPVAIYGSLLVAIVLTLGSAAYAYLVVRHHATGVRAIVGVVRQPASVALAVGTLGLLVFEAAPIWNHPFPNAWDGSATALWTNLILRQHTIPTSLAPFSSAPVIYPMATSIWMTLPVLLLGWPIVQAPVLLPPLFLSLTIPTAYAWGARWSRNLPAVSTRVGLLFAAFFGLVASWPRFYTGGWYDFAFALPLLLLFIGFLPDLGRRPRLDGATLLGVGLACGALATLSLAAGETAIVLLVAFMLVNRRGTLRDLSVRFAEVAALVLVEVAFTARSVYEWAISYGATYAPSTYYGPLNARLITGELDPFVPWKNKLSPFPPVALELQILLATGLILAIGGIVLPRVQALPRLDAGLSRSLLIGATASFLMTGFLLFTDLSGGFWAGWRSVTNLDQASIVLFIFLSGLALLPLVILSVSLGGPEPGPAVTGADRPESRPGLGNPRRSARGGYSSATAFRAIAIAILVGAFALGTTYTLTAGPGYLQSNIGKTSNVTSGDVAALEWAGAHLPSCSVVLVAPGSAAQFLPEYGTVRVAFPMNPVPRSAAYSLVVGNLTGGSYSTETRTALLSLSVTEVFVTGQTSVSYPPFLPTALLGSPDFTLLYTSGDAYLFLFGPGVSSTACAPT